MDSASHKPAKAGARPAHKSAKAAPARITSAVSDILRAHAQPKLQIGRVNDPAEVEADRVADQVMRMPASQAGDSAPTGPPLDPGSTPGGNGAPPPIRRKCASCEDDEVRRKPVEIKTKGGVGFSGGTANAEASSAIGALGSGAPLPASERSFFEPRFGRDLSSVRIHTGAQADTASRAINARAFTLGNNIAFASGEYQPGSASSRHLMAHEITHTLQGAAPVLKRKVDPDKESLQFLNDDWTQINEMGIVYKEGTLNQNGGANFRQYPGDPNPVWLPQNTKVFIVSENKKQNYFAVSTLSSSGSKFGYINRDYLWRHLPDPDAAIVKVKKGEYPLAIAAKYYSGKGFDVWGKDKRYVVNALAWVNTNAKHNTPHEAGITKPGRLDAPWFVTKSTAGHYIWLPGVPHMNAIYNTIYKDGGGTGSITADIWEATKTGLEYLGVGVGFVGGLIHGFLKSIWDMLAGLVQAVVGVLKSLFMGTIIEDAKKLWQMISSLTWQQVKDAASAIADPWIKQMQSSNPLKRGHAYGYITGYIIAEVASFFVSGGTLAAAKGAVLTSKLGVLLQKSAGFQKLATGLTKAQSKFGAAGKILKASKPFKVIKAARAWAKTRLLLTAGTLKDLSLAAINRLRLLPDEILDKLSRLSRPFKRTVLGCASPCKVDLDVINAFLKARTPAQITAGTKLTTPADVLAALPAGLAQSTIKSKLSRHPAVMKMITEAGLTSDDMKVLAKFLTPADATNATQAYKTFVRTMTTLTATKAPTDIRKFNKIAEAMVDVQRTVTTRSRAASPLKGSMFESWIKLNIHPFRSKTFGRATFSKKTHKMLTRTRTSDAFLDSTGVLWDFKHVAGYVSKVQADDYMKIVANALKSSEGKVVKQVNYLFPTKEAAELNAKLLKSKGFGVYYVSPPNVRTKLK